MREGDETKRSEIAKVVEESSVFAEVFPEHKYLIVATKTRSHSCNDWRWC